MPIQRALTTQSCWLISAFFLMLLSGCAVFAPLPSDESLIQNFVQHKSEFEQLVNMAMTDSSMSQISPTSTRAVDPSASMPAERWNAYKSLFKALRLEGGIDLHERIDGQDGIFLIARENGTSISGSLKGYLYMRGAIQLKPMLNSLEGSLPQEAKKKSGTFEYSEGFRALADHWYLYRVDD